MSTTTDSVADRVPQHWYTASLGRWTAGHQLSPQVWTAGFALMAIAMVAVRTLGLMTRFAVHPVAPQVRAPEPVVVPRKYRHHPAT